MDIVDKSCDWCRMNGQICPGVKLHCTNGEHCTFTETVCALDKAHDDHANICCICKSDLRSRG